MRAKRIAVIGGGPAGMMAAIAAARGGADVALLEKNSALGAKILITGGGRCNVTNIADPEGMIGQVLRNPRFLYSALYGLDSAALLDFFRGLGLETKIEDEGRVFPVTDKAKDVVALLTACLRNSRVKIRLDWAVTEIERREGGFFITARHREGIMAEAVIIATGGLAAPQTGSDGDGYGFAKSLGHRVTKLFPALVPVMADLSGLEIMGLSLADCGLTAHINGEIAYKGRGGVLFTHFGLSGPAVLAATAHLAERLHLKPELSLDLLPRYGAKELERLIVDLFARNSGKNAGNVLSGLLPERLAAVMPALSGLKADVKAGVVTKSDRENLCRRIKDMRVNVLGSAGWGSAVITCGGVAVEDINPATMESKLVPGLFFAGELIDVDALSGGYNLHIAFATGWLAGCCALN